MILPYDAAREIHEYLSEQGIPYVIIGGVAVQRWGEPRLTKDVDVTIVVPVEDTEVVAERLSEKFKPRIENIQDFVRQNRVLPAMAANGCEIDFSFALPGYEEVLLERAVWFEPAPKVRIKICSAEDLIIHKAVAGRPRDLQDIESVIVRQGDKLDAAYIRSWLKRFSLILETDAVLDNFEKPYQTWRSLTKGERE